MEKGIKARTSKISLRQALAWQVIVMIAATLLVDCTWDWLIAPTFKLQLPISTIFGFMIIICFLSYKPHRSSYFKSNKEMAAFAISYLGVIATLLIMVATMKLFIS